MTLNVGTNANEVFWSPATGTVTRYQIQRRLGTEVFGSDILASVGSGGILSTDVSRVFGTIYFYRVRARNTAASPGPWSDEVSTHSPTLTNFAAVPTGLGVALTWDVANGGGSDITGYTLTRKLGSDTAVPITPAPATGAMTFTDTVPAAGVYTYSLIATNLIGSSAAVTATATTTVPPPAPGKVTGVTVSAGTNANEVFWSPATGTVTRYQIQRRLATEVYGSDILAAVGAGGILSTDVSRVFGTVYFYRVRALNTLASPGEWSEEVSTANNAPVAMAGDPQTVNEGDSVTLTGDATDSDSGDSHTYTWTQSGTPMVVLGGATDAAMRTFTAPDITSATTLTFSLLVNDGTVDSDADMVEIVVNPVSTPTPPTDPPTADAPVSNFRATLTGDMVSLTWAVRADTTFSTLGLSRNDDMLSLSLSATDTTDTEVAPGIYTYSLTYTTVPVGGADAETGTLTARITATAPSVSITTRQNAQVDSVITLSATVNDPDGRLDAVSYVWTSGVHTVPMDSTVTITATLSEAATANPTFDTTGLPSGTTLNFGLTATAGTTMLMDDISITIGSGASEAQVAAVVSHVARVIMHSTASAVADRINSAGAPGGVNSSGFHLNNTSLKSSDFSLPLKAADGANGGNAMGVWARGEYADVSADSKAVEWDGDLSGFHIGMDGKINTDAGNSMLVGVAISALNSDLDYTDETNRTGSDADTGVYAIDMITTTPYLGFHSEAFDLWASVGVGDGELEITPDSGDKTNEDITQTSLAIGGDAKLVSAGDSYLRINGDVMQSELEIDNDNEQSISVNRVRIALEVGILKHLSSGGKFDSSFEIGSRYDGGDGETGTGTEFGAQINYYSARGFTAQGRVRTLLSHSGGYQDWGVQGTVHKQSGHDGQGLAFHLTPAYGNVNNGVSQLLRDGVRDSAGDDANTTTPDYQMNLTTRLGYGFALRNAGGMVTPYTEMVLGTSDQYRLGINWKPSKAFNLTLLGKQAQNTDTESTIRLTGAVNF